MQPLTPSRWLKWHGQLTAHLFSPRDRSSFTRKESRRPRDAMVVCVESWGEERWWWGRGWRDRGAESRAYETTATTRFARGLLSRSAAADSVSRSASNRAHAQPSPRATKPAPTTAILLG